MPTKLSTVKVRRVYNFIKENRNQYDVKMMCRLLEVTRSGYYAWLHEPISHRAQEDARLLRLIRASFIASHGVYGSPRVFLDLREAGETRSKHRVARLMRVTKIRPVGGYRKRHRSASMPSELVPNILLRNFDVTSPN
ncbi:MAG TPA: IS3 family transposase, partial [Candidatus Acidoferrales bacterium]